MEKSIVAASTVDTSVPNSDEELMSTPPNQILAPATFPEVFVQRLRHGPSVIAASLIRGDSDATNLSCNEGCASNNGRVSTDGTDTSLKSEADEVSQEGSTDANSVAIVPESRSPSEAPHSSSRTISPISDGTSDYRSNSIGSDQHRPEYSLDSRDGGFCREDTRSNSSRTSSSVAFAKSCPKSAQAKIGTNQSSVSKTPTSAVSASNKIPRSVPVGTTRSGNLTPAGSEFRSPYPLFDTPVQATAKRKAAGVSVSLNNQRPSTAKSSSTSSGARYDIYSGGSARGSRSGGPQSSSGRNSARTPADGSKSSLSAATTPDGLRSLVIVAIVEGRGLAKGEVGMASIDIEHPELVLTQFQDSASYSRLRTKLQIANPVEIIMPDSAVEKGGNMAALFHMLSDDFVNASVTTVHRKHFNEANGLETINHIRVPECSSLEKDLCNKYYALSCASALIKYVEFIQSIVFAPASVKVTYKGIEKSCMIDPSTAKLLELIVSLKDVRNTSFSLFGALNHTYTAGGGRLLRSTILQPPADEETIKRRLDAIEELLSKEELFYNMKSVISRMLDVDQLVTMCVHMNKQETLRMAEHKLTQIIHLKHTLDLVEPLRGTLAHCKNLLFVAYHDSLKDERFKKILTQMVTVLHEDVRHVKGTLHMRGQKCFAVRANVNGLLDIARRTYNELLEDIEECVHQINEEFRIPFKLNFAAGRGFYLQLYFRDDAVVPKKLPNVFINVVKQRSSLSCTTRQLMRYNDRYTQTVQEIIMMSNGIVNELLADIRQHIGCLYNLTEALSNIDMILSLAHACTIGRYVAGKSTYLKQVALLQLMAQMGSYVPAEYCSIRIANQIFSRISHNDDIESNSSSFTLEMKDMAYILQNMTPNSLVIIDELGRSTAIEEGIAISVAIVEEFVQSKEVFLYFATHFQQLTELDTMYPNVANYHFTSQTQIEDGRRQVALNHTLYKGPYLGPDYGFDLAEMTKLDRSLLDDAKRIYLQLKAERVQSPQERAEFLRKRAKFRLGSRVMLLGKQQNSLTPKKKRDYLELLKIEYEEDMERARKVEAEEDEI